MTKSEQKHDQLLESLVLFTKIHHVPYSAEALIAGLPLVEGANSVELFSLEKGKSLFSRAALRAGFTSRLVKKELREISSLVLPCILILKDKGACILESFDASMQHAKIITPELSDGETWVPLNVLEEHYLGHAFYLKQQYRHESKKDQLIDAHNKKGHWFWGTLLQSKKIYIDVLVASVFINIFVLASPLFTMNVYDRVVPNNAIETLWVLAIGVIVVYLFDLGLKFTRAYFLEVAGKKSDIIISSILFERVMDLKFASRSHCVGSFASNLKEFDSIRSFFTASTVAAIIDLPFTLIFLGVIHLIAGWIVIVPLVAILIILLYTWSVKEPMARSIASTYEAAAEKNGVLIESLTALETIKTMGASGHTQWKWEETTGEIAGRSLKSKLISSSIGTVTAFLTQFNIVAVIIVGVYMIEEMSLSMGALIAVVILSSRAIAPMGQVASLISNYEHTKNAYHSLNEIMKMPVERPQGKTFVQRPDFKGGIEFKNVTFSYPDETKVALDGVSFKIKAGEKVALIGKIGSGKSTIEKLLLGLYEPQEGSILIDGIDINQIDPADLRKSMAYVPQDIVLFKGTVKENISFKAPHASDSDLMKAAHIGGVDSFVNTHPLGFDMRVGERGEGLSGGQRQSIAIARAFIQESCFVILDEPTNSVDTGTEMILRKNIKAATEDKTLLLITHKESLLDLVDRIIVIDSGKVAMDGSKPEVITALTQGNK